MKNFMLYTAFFFLFAVPATADLKVSTPNTAEQERAMQRSFELITQGQALMAAGSYLAAEQDFRAALALDGAKAGADPDLAEALAAQGKTAEALQVYRALIFQYPRNMSSVAQSVHTRMHYAILLSQVGQWQEAVSVYEKNIPKATYWNAPKMDVHFDPAVPMPLQLQAMAHIAIGIECSGYAASAEAFSEFRKAARLAPNSPLANYYYGSSWRGLDPKDKAKVGSEEQAEAALQKAVKLGEGDLKRAAEKALEGLNKPAGKITGKPA